MGHVTVSTCGDALQYLSIPHRRVPCARKRIVLNSMSLHLRLFVSDVLYLCLTCMCVVTSWMWQVWDVGAWACIPLGVVAAEHVLLPLMLQHLLQHLLP